MDKRFEEALIRVLSEHDDFNIKKIQLLEGKILYFQSKYKDEMSPALRREYVNFFGIERQTEGRIN